MIIPVRSQTRSQRDGTAILISWSSQPAGKVQLWFAPLARTEVEGVSVRTAGSGSEAVEFGVAIAKGCLAVGWSAVRVVLSSIALLPWVVHFSDRTIRERAHCGGCRERDPLVEEVREPCQRSL